MRPSLRQVDPTSFHLACVRTCSGGNERLKSELIRAMIKYANVTELERRG